MPLNITDEQRAEIKACIEHYKQHGLTRTDEAIYVAGMRAAVEFLISEGFIGEGYADRARAAIRALLK